MKTLIFKIIAVLLFIIACGLLIKTYSEVLQGCFLDKPQKIPQGKQEEVLIEEEQSETQHNNYVLKIY